MDTTAPQDGWIPTRDQQTDLIQALAEVGSTSAMTDSERLLDIICDWTLKFSPLHDITLILIDHQSDQLVEVRRLVKSKGGRTKPERMWRARRIGRATPSPDIETWMCENFRDTVLITRSPIDTEGFSMDLVRPISPGSPILQEIEKNPISLLSDATDGLFLCPLVRLVESRTYTPLALFRGTFNIADAGEVIEWFWRIGTTLNEVSGNQISRYLSGPYRERQPADYELSVRETQVLSGIGDGLSNDEIADRIGISPGTVKTYRRRIREKASVFTEADMVKLAIRLELTRL